MKIQQITYRDDHGCNNYYTVGENNVIEIIEHRPMGEGDKWFYDIIFKQEDKETRTRLFNVEAVNFA